MDRSPALPDHTGSGAASTSPSQRPPSFRLQLLVYIFIYIYKLSFGRFRQVSGQTWPRDPETPLQRVRLEQWCRMHLRLAPETNYKWVFSTWFLDRPKIADSWGLGGPGPTKTTPEGEGRSPPTFLSGCWGRRGRPDPQTSTIAGRPQKLCIKDPSVL